MKIWIQLLLNYGTVEVFTIIKCVLYGFYDKLLFLKRTFIFIILDSIYSSDSNIFPELTYFGMPNLPKTFKYCNFDLIYLEIFYKYVLGPQ